MPLRALRALEGILVKREKHDPFLHWGSRAQSTIADIADIVTMSSGTTAKFNLFFIVQLSGQ